MAKIRTSFFCQNCGAQAAKWVGKCNSCGEWNTYVEEVIEKENDKTKSMISKTKRTSTPKRVFDIKASEEQRIILKDQELNRVLGGGLVPGSLVLFGGEPGIGKSTLLLQLALQNNHLKVLYISGEESEEQIKMRADRVSHTNDQCYLLTETYTPTIFHHINDIQPDVLIVDSIQTLHTNTIDSSPGSISQIKECAAELLKYAKESGTPVFMIGHITKDGQIAGPKLLEHMVDTVLQFEGDRHYIYRLLRTTKNRFGSTNELGIYEMNAGGLREIENPSEILITYKDEPLSGVAIAATMEGMRPLLIEIQALASTAAYGTPQRSANGFDARRLNMLLAVLEKRCGFRLAMKDVFVNITGGIKTEDPAVDLALMCAVLSSAEDMPIHPGVCFCAEVGLSGELRTVNRIDARISEAEKLGFKKIVISKYNEKNMTAQPRAIEVVKLSRIDEVFNYLFG
jgi:DNA repair protein RadA/Sms